MSDRIPDLPGFGQSSAFGNSFGQSSTDLFALAGSALQAGAGLVSAKMNYNQTKKVNQANQKWALDMYEMQKKDNLAYWGMQNEYNSPQAQMRRFQQAGLNPNLIYGQGTSGNASAVSAPAPQNFTRQTPQISADGVVSGVQGYFNLKAQQAQTNNLRLQNTVIAEQALNAHLDNVEKSRELGYLKEKGLFKGGSLALSQYIDHLRSMVLGYEAENAKFSQPFLRSNVVQENRGKKLSNDLTAANISSVLSNIGFRKQEVDNHTRTVELAQKKFFQDAKESNWHMSQGDKQYLHMIYQDAYDRTMRGNEMELRNTVKHDLEQAGLSASDVINGVNVIMNIMSTFNKRPMGNGRPTFQKPNSGMSPNQKFNF